MTHRVRTTSLLGLLAVAAVAGALAPASAGTAGVPAARADFAAIAHRGASGLAPEHTIAAYDLALAMGADYIEQDVHLTLDGHLVVLHDDTLDRTTDGPAESCSGPVRTKTLAQVRTCDAGSWFNRAHPDRARPEYVGMKVPTLEEVFARYGRTTSYHIETKTPEAAPLLVERELLRQVDRFGLRGGAHTDWKVLVQSFSPASLQRMALLDPALPTVQLLAAAPPPAVRAQVLDRIADYAIGVGPSHGGVDAAFVEAAHAVCLEVHPYTVDDPARMRALVDAGVDGLFTNRPDLLDAVLGRDVGTDEPRPAAAPLAAARNRACRAAR